MGFPPVKILIIENKRTNADGLKIGTKATKLRRIDNRRLKLLN